MWSGVGAAVVAAAEMIRGLRGLVDPRGLSALLV
jgi:hypothetical protein